MNKAAIAGIRRAKRMGLPPRVQSRTKIAIKWSSMHLACPPSHPSPVRCESVISLCPCSMTWAAPSAQPGRRKGAPAEFDGPQGRSTGALYRCHGAEGARGRAGNDDLRHLALGEIG